MFGSESLEDFWQSGIPGILAIGTLIIWFVIWLLRRWFR